MTKKFAVLFFCFSIFATQCKNKEVILSREDRMVIDTTSTSQIVKLRAELDKWCVDSTPIIKQKFIDSLLVVRQAEINKRLGK